MSEYKDAFAPPGHFYSPITDAHEAELHLDRVRERDGPLLGINLNDDLIQNNWNVLSNAAADIPFTERANEQLRYYYLNDQFSFGDACTYYAQLKSLRPSKIIEIGSGYSSALALDTCEILDLDTNLIFIEPYPQRLNNLLRKSDTQRVTLIEDKVQNVDLSVFEELQENDILFIDSSHVAKTGSDVCFEVFEIIPRLNSGVYIMIHDMFYPFEYSKRWSIDEGRSWNELYLIRALLMYNQKLSIEFFNHYFALKFPELAHSKCPLFMKNCGGSLWLKVQ